jgi:hypothetical protein
MAKKTKNQTPPKGNTLTKRKSPLSIVTHTKQVKKKGKSTEFKCMKTALFSSLSVFLLSSLSAPLLASSSPPMSLLSTLSLLSVRMATSCLTPSTSSSSSPLRATTAPSFLTLFTPKKEEDERCYFTTRIVVSREACI